MHTRLHAHSLITLQTDINEYGDYGILNGFTGKIRISLFRKDEAITHSVDLKYSSWIIQPAKTQKIEHASSDILRLFLVLFHIITLFHY